MKNIFIIIVLLNFGYFALCMSDEYRHPLEPLICQTNQNVVKQRESIQYALLIGGGANKISKGKTFYTNISYVNQTLKQLGYKDENIKILFHGDSNLGHLIIEGDATKENVMKELNRLKAKIDSSDSLLIFRSGHGVIDFIFEHNGILSKHETASVLEEKIIGTCAVMVFPDEYLTYLELQKKMKEIKAKQQILILNQCFAGQFTNIAMEIDHAVVISETSDIEIAFTKKDDGSKDGLWPFVKCICDGFIKKNPDNKQSVFYAFQYVLTCHPGVRGVPIQADRPLWKVTPQIKYGNGLEKGSVYIK